MRVLMITWLLCVRMLLVIMCASCKLGPTVYTSQKLFRHFQ